MTNPNYVVQTIPNNPTPPIIIHQDNSTFPTSIILDETNYPLWSQLMERCIDARNKSGYLIGATKKPEKLTLLYVVIIVNRSFETVMLRNHCYPE